MAKPTKPTSSADDVKPQDIAQVPPPVRDLYAISDIRFVMMEIAKYGEQISRLTTDVSRLSDSIKSDFKDQGNKITNIERSVDRVKTGAIVAATILTVVGGIFWWAIGDRITAAVRSSLVLPSAPVTSPVPTTLGTPAPASK